MTFRKLDGTTIESFSIGVGGVTIHQGEDAPPSGLGASGDLYLRHGDDPAVYGKGTAWEVVAYDPGPFVRGTIYRGRTLDANAVVSMISVLRNPFTIDSTDVTIDSTVVTIDNDLEAFTAIRLPAGTEGQSVIVKDETSRAGAYEIRVSDVRGEVIDGQNAATVQADRGFVELLFSGGSWRVVGR